MHAERDASYSYQKRSAEDARGLLAEGGGDGQGAGQGEGGGVSFGARLVACQKQLKELLGTGASSGDGGASLVVQLRKEKDDLERKLKQKESLCSGGTTVNLLGAGSSGRSDGQAANGRLLASMQTEKELLQAQLTLALEQANSLEGGVGGSSAGSPYEAKQLRLENEVLRARVQKLEAASREQPGSGRGTKSTAEFGGPAGVTPVGTGQLEKAECEDAASQNAEIGVLKEQVKQLETQLKSAQESSGAKVASAGVGSNSEGCEACPKCECASGEAQGASTSGGAGAGNGSAEELEAMRKKVEHSETLVERLMTEKRQLTRVVAECSGNMSSASGQLAGLEAKKALEAAKKAIDECGAKQGGLPCVLLEPTNKATYSSLTIAFPQLETHMHHKEPRMNVLACSLLHMPNNTVSGTAALLRPRCCSLVCRRCAGLPERVKTVWLRGNRGGTPTVSELHCPGTVSGRLVLHTAVGVRQGVPLPSKEEVLCPLSTQVQGAHDPLSGVAVRPPGAEQRQRALGRAVLAVL